MRRCEKDDENDQKWDEKNRPVWDFYCGCLLSAFGLHCLANHAVYLGPAGRRLESTTLQGEVKDAADPVTAAVTPTRAKGFSRGY